MAHWSTAPMDRLQVTLFAPTLDDTLAIDHPVRLFDELLRGIDFSGWEGQYVRVVGQPPIHPRVMAECILYGLTLGIRSSRKLEDACCNRLDFIWLMEGRTPDHSTICGFRTQFARELKEAFKRVGRVGVEMGLVTLNQMNLDGTDTRGNNSRFNTARRASLEQKLKVLDEQVERLMAQAAEQDRVEDDLFGQESSPTKLPRELGDLKCRQAKLKEAMERLSERERERAGRKDVSKKGVAVPLADPDARVLPNKTGGFAPNYTSVLATDSDSGMIMDTQVLPGNDEASTVLPAVDNVEQNFGTRPRQLNADTNFNSGPNLQGLQERGVEALMPGRQVHESVQRPDPTQPVAEARRVSLPVNPQNKVLDKSAFLYDPSKDCYFCPMGKVLEYAEDKPYNRHGTKGTYRVYECASCAGCPLAARCLPKKATARRVCRDEYEPLREEMAARMNSERGRAQYKRRAHGAETPFAVLKAVMNFRQFLLRGLEKVKAELCWAATAYNLMKLVRALAARRAAAVATAAIACQG